MKDSVIITLPKRIYMMKPCPHSSIGVGQKKEEYNLYFSNFIYPLLSDFEVQVRCDYGRNYGDYWRIFEFPDELEEFPITIAVYDGYGKELARKTCVVELYTDEQAMEDFRVLPIGDSMTQSQFYLEHTMLKLSGLRFEGSRCFNGIVRHEGRGGFRTEDYVYKYQDPHCPSPFVFPKEVSGKEYYGDQTFYENMITQRETYYYVYGGYEHPELKEGMYYNRENTLYRKVDGQEVLHKEGPEWEFSFPKYMEKNSFERVDAVSILLGTNDILGIHYDILEKGIARVIENLGVMIDSIREYSSTIPIILNMPILPTTDAYSFGRNFACSKLSKESRAVMLRFIEAMLDKWDNCDDRNIYLVPMNASIHPVLAFPKEAYSDGRYFSEPIVRVQDSIHPNRAGYAQMGDYFAAAIQKIRVTEGK